MLKRNHGALIHCRGFTFIEVLAVIAILAGLWTLILPQMASRDDLRAGAAARVLIADLLYAQNRAISTQTTQYVRFTLGGGGSNGGYTIYDQQPFATPITNPLTQQSYTVTFGAGSVSQMNSISLAALNLDGVNNPVLAFNELGQPLVSTVAGPPVALSSTGTITLQSGSQTLALSIEPDTGNMTLP